MYQRLAPHNEEQCNRVCSKYGGVSNLRMDGDGSEILVSKWGFKSPSQD